MYLHFYAAILASFQQAVDGAPDFCTISACLSLQASTSQPPAGPAEPEQKPRTTFTYDGKTFTSDPIADAAAEADVGRGLPDRPAASDLDMRLCSSTGEVTTSVDTKWELPGSSLLAALLSSHPPWALAIVACLALYG